MFPTEEKGQSILLRSCSLYLNAGHNNNFPLRSVSTEIPPYFKGYVANQLLTWMLSPLVYWMCFCYYCYIVDFRRLLWWNLNYQCKRSGACYYLTTRANKCQKEYHHWLKKRFKRTFHTEKASIPSYRQVGMRYFLAFSLSCHHESL